MMLQPIINKDLIIFIIILAVQFKVSSLADHNVLQSSIYRPQNGPNMAVDDNKSTCAKTKSGLNQFWKIQFSQRITVNVIQLRLKGGKYSVEVRNSSSELADRHIYSRHLAYELSIYSENISFTPAVPMDVIIINRTDTGSLALCDFQLRVCLDVPCTVCTIEDTCRHCDDSHHGPTCENNYVSESCDEATEWCSACLHGYSEEQCRLNGTINGQDMRDVDDVGLNGQGKRGHCFHVQLLCLVFYLLVSFMAAE
ncbi:uncharacterized protein LOC111118177 [Crassostrea virginica]